jgi:nitrite reductase/ring-hydroxylating ferredoxin subunit/multimeric flavodoxin WrbA
MVDSKWHDLGPVEKYQTASVQPIKIERTQIALTWLDGQFGAVSGLCNHAGGPLGEGHLDGEYIVCPWHHWKFHCRTGLGEPGFEEDVVPRYDVKVEGGRLWIDLASATKRQRKPHAPHPLARKPQRQDGPIRVAGISTTIMDRAHPRFSTSDFLLDHALAHAKDGLACDTQRIALNELKFRSCEGYYSKSARACTWPCSITQMDDTDQMDRVYEAMVHWADVIVVSTPIRWGAASSLYYKMAERMNCVQNQITIANRSLIHSKVVVFIITGGQDNVQAVAGQMLGFFAELGFIFPQHPYIAHSRGWTAEDMEQNVVMVHESDELQEGARMLVTRAVELSKTLLKDAPESYDRLTRGGRKAHHLANQPHRSVKLQRPPDAQ